MDTNQFIEQINTGDFDSLFKFNDEITRTEVNFESFLRRLSKQMQDSGVKFIQDAEKAWRAFKWKSAEYSLKHSLTVIEDKIKSQMARNEEEFKAQMEEYIKKSQQVHEVRKIKENPLNKEIKDLIIPDKKLDKNDEREQTSFVQILIIKREQVLYLKENYKQLLIEQDGTIIDYVCPNSLQYCNVKQEYMTTNKEFRCLRMLVFKDYKKRIIEKLKGKGFVVKEMESDSNSNKMSDVVDKSNENLQSLETELSEMKHSHENFLKDIYVSSQEIQMHIKFMKLQVESKLSGGYNDQDYQFCVIPTKSDEKFKQIMGQDYDDDTKLISIMMPDI